MAASLGATPVVIPNETLGQASELGHISPGLDLQEVGSIGRGPDGAADVQWYRFTLDGPALVSFDLSRQDPSSSFNGVVSLFNNDPFDFGDPYNPDGNRLLEQVDGKADGGVASFQRLLGQGTYYVAVSGDGNFDFHPLLAGSGLPGSTGDFNLRLGATDAGLGSATGPQVLTSDPAPRATLHASPLAIRVDLSGPLDPSTVVLGQTVQLLYSPDGRFTLDGQQVPLSTFNFSPVVEAPPSPGVPAADSPQYQGLNELQLFPTSPLTPGYYEVVLAGQGTGGSMILADPMGNPLGADAAHPQGQDATIPFQVDGIDGIAGATGSDNTASGAHELGDVTSAGLVQVAGAIGVDPSSPFNQVDVYHFTVTGAGNNSLVAEVFAGRIGSPLDPGVCLFRREPDGSFRFVAGNNNTNDPAVTTDGFWSPLVTDSALYAGLTAGDYYIAVAYGWNTPSPFEGQPSGVPGSGFFDLNDPASAQNNFFSTGPYVLNLLVQPAPTPPHVVSTSPAAGATLTQPPTRLVVKFDQPMNIVQLAFEKYQSSQQDIVPGIYIEGADGKTRYYPRFESYDASTNEATFLMIDALPDGDYHLHLSNAAGLADIGDGLADQGGNPLVGDDPSGDYVVPFSVDGPPRGTGGNPLAWTDQEPNDDINHPQDLGVLFPAELAAGVTISRDFRQDPAAAPQDTADVYRFQILQGRMYTISLSGANLPAGVTLSLTGPSGQDLGLNSLYGGRTLLGQLAPGTYLLTVGGWDAAQAAGISYRVSLKLDTQTDNAPPLLSGPASAIAIQLDSAATPTTPTPPPPPVTPPVTDPPPPVTDPPPVTPPPVVDPPVTGSSPIGPPSSGGDPSTSAAPAAAAAAIAIAMPAQFQGGPSAYGVTSTDVGALAASPMGGALAPAGEQAAGAQLAQSNAGIPQSPVTTGLIVLGTSLQVVGPADEAATPNGPESAEAPMAEVRDRGAIRARLALLGERTLAMVAGIGDYASAMAAGLVEGDDRPSPNPGPREEATAGHSPQRTEPTVSTSRDEAPTGQSARVVILAVAGLALGAYARYRGFARRDGSCGEVRNPARPVMLTRRSLQGVGMERSQV